MVKCYIHNYKGVHSLFVVSKNETLTEYLISQDRHVMYIIGEKIVFFPENTSILSFDLDIKRINKLNNLDIVEITERGILTRIYSNASNDVNIVTTSSCNSNCLMCPMSENSRKYGLRQNVEILKTFIDYLPESVKYMTITGGEPTLAGKDFIAIVGYLANKFKNSKTQLLTNGRSFSNTEFFDQFCSNAPQNIRVAIPIHANTAYIHDEITQVSGSFEQTIKGIHNLLNANMEVEIRIVVSKLNIQYIKGIAKLIINNFPNVHCVNFIGLEVRGNAAKNIGKVWIEYADAFISIKESIDMLVAKGIDVGLYNFPLCSISRGYWSIASKSISEYKIKYYTACNNCLVKDICGGLFNSTYTIAKPHINPFLNEDLR